MIPAGAVEWSTAYARQAASDLEARDWILQNSKIAQCHHLHYLQMACEKLCKAHLAGTGVPPETLRTSHAYVAGTLPVIARQILSREAGRLPKETWVLRAIRKLSRQIELLAPAVEAGGRVPSNCEYPWVGPDGRIVAPADHAFGLDLLYERAGVTLFKILRVACDELLTATGSQPSDRIPS